MSDNNMLSHISLSDKVMSRVMWRGLMIKVYCIAQCEVIEKYRLRYPEPVRH